MYLWLTFYVWKTAWLSRISTNVSLCCAGKWHIEHVVMSKKEKCFIFGPQIILKHGDFVTYAHRWIMDVCITMQIFFAHCYRWEEDGPFIWSGGGHDCGHFQIFQCCSNCLPQKYEKQDCKKEFVNQWTFLHFFGSCNYLSTSCVSCKSHNIFGTEYSMCISSIYPIYCPTNTTNTIIQ